jgi:CubicO group peptidase (beta-lactamase class C family)
VRAIFIKGVSGAGKTTAAGNLYSVLRDMGHYVKLYLESDAGNPVDFYSTAYLSPRDYADLLARYQSFAADTERGAVAAGEVRLVRYFSGNEPLYPEPLLSELRKREFCYNPASPVPADEYTRVYWLRWERFRANTPARPAL